MDLVKELQRVPGDKRRYQTEQVTRAQATLDAAAVAVAQDQVVTEARAVIDYYKKEDQYLESKLFGRTILHSKEVVDKNARYAEYVKAFKDGALVEGNQIKRICDRYALRVLPIALYGGMLGTETIPKIRQLRKQLVGIHGQFNDDKLYIMAPKSMFKLDRRPVLEFDTDPILLYALDGGNHDLQTDTTCVVVDKWGTDLSPARRINGLVAKYKWFYLGAMIVAAVYAVLTQWIDASATVVAIFTPVSGLVYWGIMAILRNEDKIDVGSEWTSHYR